MSPIVKRIVFGLSVFVVFLVIALVLKLVSGQQLNVESIPNLFSSTDLLLGLVVALVVTMNHERKTKNSKKQE